MSLVTRQPVGRVYVSRSYRNNDVQPVKMAGGSDSLDKRSRAIMLSMT